MPGDCGFPEQHWWCGKPLSWRYPWLGPQWPVGGGTERLRSNKIENLRKDPQAKRKTSERIHRQKSLLFWKHFWLRSRRDFAPSGMTLWITWEILLHSGATFGATQAFVTHQPSPCRDKPAFLCSPLASSASPSPFWGGGAPPQQEDGAVGSWSKLLEMPGMGEPGSNVIPFHSTG